MDTLKVKPEYLSQRDNLSSEGTPDHFTQCFIASDTMFLRWAQKTYQPSKKTLIDERAWLAAIENNLSGRETRFFWAVHERALNKVLNRIDAPFTLRAIPANIQSIAEQIESGFPTILSMMGTAYKETVKGHVWLAYWTEKNPQSEIGFGGHDPYGNALTGWKDQNGNRIFYGSKDLRKMILPTCHYFKVIHK
ncbi:hypothetical protein [Leptospira sp. 'Mane']|uniref:hypothetical protein n=1 Tax=Leptospira sp. 'Mane' TaxID=3387407 RepID=UPI00398A8771